MYPWCKALRTVITSIRNIIRQNGNRPIEIRRVTSLNSGGTYTDFIQVNVTRTLMTVRDPLPLKQAGAERTMYGQTGVYFRLTITSFVTALTRRGSGSSTTTIFANIRVRLRWTTDGLSNSTARNLSVRCLMATLT